MTGIQGLYSQKARFFLQSDKSEVVAGTLFRLEAVLENMDADEITLGNIQPFKVVQGPSRSSSISIINGKKSESLTYIWLVKAPDEGTYTIAPATVAIGSRTLSSNSLRVVVTEASALPPNSEGVDELFVRLETTTKAAYTGQQIIVDLVLYTAVEVAIYQIINTIETRGMFIKMAENTDFPTQRVSLGGRSYYSKVLRRYFVFPQKTGIFKLNALQVSAEVVSGRGMGFSIFGDTYQKELLSNPLELNVQDIPTDAPSHYSGGVGDYAISCSTQSKSIVKGGTAVLTLFLEGDGDPKKCKNPEIQTPQGLDAFDPVIKKDEWIEQGGRMRMYREVEYTFVPSKDTVFRFAPVFNYFSTRTKQYEDVVGDTITWQVVSDHETISESQGSNNSVSDDETKDSVWNSILAKMGFLWKYVLPVLILLMVIFFARRKRTIIGADLNASPVELKQHSMAKIHLDAARVYQKTGSSDAFLRELDMAVLAKLQELLSITLSGCSRTEIVDLLSRHGLTQDMLDQYIVISQTIDQLRFGGLQPSGATNFLDDVNKFLNALDDKIP